MGRWLLQLAVKILTILLLSINFLLLRSKEKFWIMYHKGSCILWGASTDTSVDTRSSTGRYIGPVSTDVSNDSPLNNTHGVGRHIDRDTVSGISVNYRLYIGRLSVKYRSILDQYLVRLNVQEGTLVNKYLNAHW